MVMALKEALAEEVITIEEEEAAVRQEEEAFLVTGLISLLQAVIRDRITVIIVI